MYHCHVQFYLVGRQCNIFEVIKKMPPLEAFTHTFFESEKPEPSLAAKADVILADFGDMNISEGLRTLGAGEDIKGKDRDTEIILLADREKVSLSPEDFQKVSDIWSLPMSEEEAAFRFYKWQKDCKVRKDFWQTSHYLETTINSIPNLVWYKDKDGVHEKVNDSFCATVNKTKQQVEGQRHAYIWDVEHDDPACIESEAEVMRTGKTCISEETVMTGEGTKLLTTYKSPLYNVDGDVMGTVGVAIDVTKERAYEKELISKNHALETIFTTMDCGVISQTLDGQRILSVNRAALQILGYESQEELQKQGFDMVSVLVIEEDREETQRRIESLEKEGDSVSLEYRIRGRGGEVQHIMGNAKLIIENGELACQRLFVDCTEQKRQEEKEREESKRRQMELVQALSVDYNLVCFFDLDGGEGMLLRLEDEEDGMFRTAFAEGRSLREGLEHYIEEFVHEDDKDTLREWSARKWLGKELAEKQLFYANYRVRRGNDIEYFQMKVVRAGTWDGSRGVVLGLRSVDEEVRNEMEKNSLLEDALSQANRANKAKSVFLSNMSHDIRTPMNAIVGFTSLAINHIDRREQVEEYLKKIMTSGKHLLSLINDILDMSRIESGKMQLEEKACSLPDILHELRNILQADVRSKQLELQMDTVDVVNEDVYCDKLRLNQILLNLLGNSVKFTPAGGTVSLRVTEKAGAPAGYASYEFQVTDTGIGMSREFAAHIFEPFSRERSSTVSGIQGTGLGMAITKNIVDMLGGSIEVESTEGEGTKFTVFLTLRLLSEEKEPLTIPELSGCRALVVDDDFNSCDSVSYMLQQVGMRAEWTLSGKEAVLRMRQAAMRGDTYSIYIVDWLLPDMNGIEVTRRIRQEVGEEAPIIILTSYDWADIEEEAREAGVTTFCSKPLFLSELRKCLCSVVNVGAEYETCESRETHEIRTGRILLAEDNELNQEIAETILTEAGFTVEIAENGQIAVDMVKASNPGYYQVVLMDVRMPVMDGYGATRAIRRLENKELASIPVIAMTANAFEEDRQEAIRQGMNAHIAKPINIKILFDTLDRVLPGISKKPDDKI